MKKCEWEQSYPDHDPNMPWVNHWRSPCGEAHISELEDWTYCPYCGGEIEIQEQNSE